MQSKALGRSLPAVPPSAPSAPAHARSDRGRAAGLAAAACPGRRGTCRGQKIRGKNRVKEMFKMFSFARVRDADDSASCWHGDPREQGFAARGVPCGSRLVLPYETEHSCTVGAATTLLGILGILHLADSGGAGRTAWPSWWPGQLRPCAVSCICVLSSGLCSLLGLIVGLLCHDVFFTLTERAS